MKEKLSKYSNAEAAFSDLVGHAVGAARNYSYAGAVYQVRGMRPVFYGRLAEFRRLGLPPQGNVTPEAIAGFDEFRERDWAEPGVVDAIVTHYYTIIPNTQRQAEIHTN